MRVFDDVNDWTSHVVGPTKIVGGRNGVPSPTPLM